MTDLLPRPPQKGRALHLDGASVAVDETAREPSERQVLPAEDLRERFEQ
jgi:hypothetical protein